MTQVKTQKERMNIVLDSIDYEKLSDTLNELRQILGEAQNRPPLGEADGTIDYDSWNRLRSACHSLAAFINTTEEIKL